MEVKLQNDWLLLRNLVYINNRDIELSGVNAYNKNSINKLSYKVHPGAFISIIAWIIILCQKHANHNRNIGRMFQP